MDEPQVDQRIRTFIANLSALDAGGRAKLKRSAGKRLDEASRSLALFYRVLPRSGVPERQESIYWLIATLYPLADAATTGSFGAALHRARSAQYQKGLDRRVEALLDSDETQLAYRLGQTVRFLRSNRVPINWQGLLEDLLCWNHPSHFVQKRWAKDYFGAPQSPSLSSVSLDSAAQEEN